jgi:hypothetical protein
MNRLISSLMMMMMRRRRREILASGFRVKFTPTRESTYILFGAYCGCSIL